MEQITLNKVEGSDAAMEESIRELLERSYNELRGREDFKCVKELL